VAGVGRGVKEMEVHLDEFFKESHTALATTMNHRASDCTQNLYIESKTLLLSSLSVPLDAFLAGNGIQ